MLQCLLTEMGAELFSVDARGCSLTKMGLESFLLQAIVRAPESFLI